jgi:hypothetical protein
MARAAINRGTTAGDGTGETAFSAFGKVNDNFVELYTGFVHPGYRVGKFYVPPGYGGSQLTAAAAPVDTIRFIPFILPQTVTIDRIGAAPMNGSTSSNQAAFAIYAANATTKRPTGTPLVDCSATLAAGNTPFSISCPSTQLQQGVLYWFGVNNNINVQQWSVTHLWPFGQIIGGDLISILNGGSNNPVTHLSWAHTFGSWPDMTSNSPTEQITTAWATMGFRVASVP